MAAKSPTVQPMRHRVVLTEALFQADFKDQKSLDVIDGGVDGCEALFLLQHWLLVRCFWRLILIEGTLIAVA